MERCPNCGASIRTGARFCTACGFRLVQPAGTPAVTAPVDDLPIDVPVASSDASPSSGSDSQRVVWQGDSGSPEEAEAPSLPSPPASTSNGDGSSIFTPQLAPSPVDGEFIPEHPATDQTNGVGREGFDTEPTSLGAETDERSIGTAAVSDASSTSGDGIEASPDSTGGQELPPVDIGDAAAAGMSDYERSETDQSDSIAGSDAPAISPSRSDLGVMPTETLSYAETDAVAESTDEDTVPSNVRATDQDGDADLDSSGGIETEPTDAPASSPVEADESLAPDESPTNTAAGASAVPVMWQDDVVIETSFMAETDQPGSYHDEADVSAESRGTGQDADFDEAGSDTAAPAEQHAHDGFVQLDDPQPELTSSGHESETATGRDEDYEPWGDAGLSDAESAANGGGDASGLPIGQGGPSSADHQQDGARTTGLAEARMLLDQLRSAIDTLDQSPPEQTTNPASELAITSMAEIGQILDGFPSPAVDADRLAEVTRLAEDLSGRDYDIRALQTFAHERETILSLAMELQQLRDVIDQIRSVLGQSES